MDFDAITIDTCIFERENFNLENGLLSRFDQFSRTPDIKFIISDIVFREIISHMEEKTKSAISNYNKALKNGLFYRIDNDITEEKIKKIKTWNERDLVKTRLEEYAYKTGLQVIPAKNIDIQKIIKQYFNKKPPFSEKKKDEFPDALALQSLENWATEKNKKVLVISCDKDWQAYCQNNTNLICVKKIEEALSSLYKSKSFILQLFKDIFSNYDKYESLMNRINEEIMNSSDRLSIDIDVTSSCKYNEDYLEFDFLDVLFPDADSIEIIDYDEDQKIASFSIPAELTFTIESGYTFYLTDEGEDIGIGNNIFNDELEFNTNLIISIQLDEDTLEDSEIISVDYKDYTFNHSISLEPDFSDDYDYRTLEKEQEDIR